MSYAQAPFNTNYSSSSTAAINVSSETSANEDDLITFIKGTAGNGKTLYVDSSFKYKPSTGTITSVGVDVSSAITDLVAFPDVGTPANQFELYHSSGQLIFNNDYAPTVAIPLIVNGGGEGVEIKNLQLSGYSDTTRIELDTPIITDEDFDRGIGFVGLTDTDYSTLATKTTPTSTSSGALITVPIQACNPNNKNIKVSFPLNAYNNFTRTSGTFAIDVNLTALTVSMTRNGSNFTNFAYLKPTLPKTFRYSMSAGTTFTNIQQPFFQLEIYFTPTDSIISGGTPAEDEYIIKIVPTFTTTTITGVGTRTGLNGGAGFDIDIGTVHSTAPTNFTFSTADPTCSALAITKSGVANKTILRPYYLTSEYLNLTYQRTFTSEETGIELNCFLGGYIHYDITLLVSTAPTAYTALTFGLADETGTTLTTGYSGTTAVLGSTYSVVSWSGSALIAYLPSNTRRIYKWTISYPNNGFRKTISGTNPGTASVSIVEVPMVSCGQNSTATAYNSCFWGVVGTAVSGIITITGRNS